MSNRLNLYIKPYSILGLLLTISLGVFAYYEYVLLGFPDGHLTEFDKFCKEKLYPIFLAGNAVFTLLFFQLLFIKAKRKWILYTYIVFVAICIIVLLYAHSVLDNGQGG